MNRLMFLVLIAAALCCNASQCQPPEVKEAAEKYILTHLLPRLETKADLEGTTAMSRDIARSIAREQGDSQAKTGFTTDELNKLLESAQKAKVLNKRELAKTESTIAEGYDVSDEIRASAKWKFKNGAERNRRILELEIRQKLLPDSQPQLHYPVASTLSYSSLGDGSVVKVSSRRDGLRFEQRVSDDAIHAYGNLKVGPGGDKQVRFAIYSMPADIAENLELGRVVEFFAILHGTEKYESVTGPRTVIRMHYLDGDFVNKLIADHTPKIAKPDAKTITRHWTSVDGKFKVEARMETLENDAIALVKKDGSKITVPLSKLSHNDTEWAKAYLAATGPWDGPEL